MTVRVAAAMLLVCAILPLDVQSASDICNKAEALEMSFAHQIDQAESGPVICDDGPLACKILAERMRQTLEEHIAVMKHNLAFGVFQATDTECGTRLVEIVPRVLRLRKIELAELEQ